jgi:hypothetical protein
MRRRPIVALARSLFTVSMLSTADQIDKLTQ